VGKDFEIFNHTADIGILAYGADVKQAFANAARGLFSLIVELDEIAVKEQNNIEVSAPDQEALLVNWLNELIYIADTKEMLFKDFEIIDLSETEIKAKGYGEKIDTRKHHLKREVKAATYHMLKIEPMAGGWKTRVVFDI
jgi:SHS2 domain-containing protein